MADTESDYVVFIEQTYDNGLIVEEVRATDSRRALDKAYELNGVDPLYTVKAVRDSWVVKGKLC